MNFGLTCAQRLSGLIASSMQVRQVVKDRRGECCPSMASA